MPAELYEARQALEDQTRRAAPTFKNGWKRAGTLGDVTEAAPPSVRPQPCKLHGATACVPCGRIALAAQAERDKPKDIARAQSIGDIRK